MAIGITVIDDGRAGADSAIRSLRILSTVSVLVGIRGTARTRDGESIAAYARINEFGSKRGGRVIVPERSFLRSTMRENRRAYLLGLRDAAQAVFEGFSVDQAFGVLGLQAVADVQRKIRIGPFTPNAPSTVRKKGSSRPLIDNGTMRQSIEYRIDRRSGLLSTRRVRTATDTISSARRP